MYVEAFYTRRGPPIHQRYFFFIFSFWRKGGGGGGLWAQFFFGVLKNHSKWPIISFSQNYANDWWYYQRRLVGPRMNSGGPSKPWHFCLCPSPHDHGPWTLKQTLQNPASWNLPSFIRTVAFLSVSTVNDYNRL